MSGEREKRERRETDTKERCPNLIHKKKKREKRKKIKK